MGNLSCGNLNPPPSSGGHFTVGLPSALHEDYLNKMIPPMPITIPRIAEKVIGFPSEW